MAEPLADVGEWAHPFERFWRHRLTVPTDLSEESTMAQLDDTRSRTALDRMGPGWRDRVLPELARVAAEV